MYFLDLCVLILFYFWFYQFIFKTFSSVPNLNGNIMNTTNMNPPFGNRHQANNYNYSNNNATLTNNELLNHLLQGSHRHSNRFLNQGNRSQRNSSRGQNQPRFRNNRSVTSLFNDFLEFNRDFDANDYEVMSILIIKQNNVKCFKHFFFYYEF